MADNQEASGIVQDLGNRTKSLLNRFGGNFNQSGADPSRYESNENVQSLIGIDYIKKINDAVRHHASVWKQKVEHTREKIKTRYETMGPYEDKHNLERENELIKRGCEAEQVEFNKDEISFTYPLPKAEHIAAGPHLSYDVRFFGTSRTDNYWDELKKALFTACDKRALDVKSDRHVDGAVVDQNVAALKEQIGQYLQAAKDSIGKIEEEHRQRLEEFNTQIHQFESLRTEIKGNRNPLIGFQHSYRVLVPESVVDAYKGHFKRDEEVAEGLDEYGWPLEVADGETKYRGQTIPKGTVLVDYYKKALGLLSGEVRRIDVDQYDTLTVDCDIMETANWIYASYDSYINDLRDGRYHPQSTTAMDNVMTELLAHSTTRVTELSHNQTLQEVRAGKQARVHMNLNTGRGAQFMMQPSHLNPAFDLSAPRDLPVHLGRLYYYDVNNYCVPSPDKMISSRGAGLYVLHEAINSIKFTGKDGQHTGIREFLEHLGAQTGGFDVGPNVQELYTTFKFKNDPFS